MDTAESVDQSHGSEATDDIVEIKRETDAKGYICAKFECALKEGSFYELIRNKPPDDLFIAGVPLYPIDELGGPTSFVYVIDVKGLANVKDLFHDKLGGYSARNGTHNSNSSKRKAVMDAEECIEYDNSGDLIVTCYQKKHKDLPRLTRFVVRILRDYIPIKRALIGYVFAHSGSSITALIISSNILCPSERRRAEEESSRLPPSSVASKFGISNKAAQYIARSANRKKSNKGPAPASEEEVIDRLVYDGSRVKQRTSEGNKKTYMITSDVMVELFMSILTTTGEMEKDDRSLRDFISSNPTYETVSEKFGGRETGSISGVCSLDVTFGIIETEVITVFSFFCPHIRLRASGKIAFFPLVAMISRYHGSADMRKLFRFIDDLIMKTNKNKRIRSLITDQESSFLVLHESVIARSASHIYCGIHIGKNAHQTLSREAATETRQALFGKAVSQTERLTGILDELTEQDVLDQWERKRSTLSDSAEKWIAPRIGKFAETNNLFNRTRGGTFLNPVTTNNAENWNGGLKEYLGPAKRSVSQFMVDFIEYLSDQESSLLASTHCVSKYVFAGGQPFRNSLLYHAASPAVRAEVFKGLGCPSLADVEQMPLKGIPACFFPITSCAQKLDLLADAKRMVVFSKSDDTFIVSSHSQQRLVAVTVADHVFSCKEKCRSYPCSHIICVLLSLKEESWKEIIEKMPAGKKLDPMATHRTGRKGAPPWVTSRTFTNDKKIVYSMRRRSQSLGKSTCDVPPSQPATLDDSAIRHETSDYDMGKGEEEEIEGVADMEIEAIEEEEIVDNGEKEEQMREGEEANTVLGEIVDERSWMGVEVEELEVVEIEDLEEDDQPLPVVIRDKDEEMRENMVPPAVHGGIAHGKWRDEEIVKRSELKGSDAGRKCRICSRRLLDSSCPEFVKRRVNRITRMFHPECVGDEAMPVPSKPSMRKPTFHQLPPPLFPPSQISAPLISSWEEKN